MEQDNGLNKTDLQVLKSIHIVFLAVTLLFIGLHYMGVIGSSLPLLNLEAMLQFQIIVPAVFAIAFYILALKVKGWWLREETDRETGLIKGNLARSVFLIAVAGMGLWLGSEGVTWQFTLPVFLASSLTLIFTFPTQER